METAFEVAVTPDESVAMATRLYVPSVTERGSHWTRYGAVVSGEPMLTPLSWNCTLATPMLSDATAFRTIGPETANPFCGAVTTTVGGVVSTGLLTVMVVPVVVVVFPATSQAVAERT